MLWSVRKHLTEGWWWY